MAILKNARWERFAQEIASGKDGSHAYQAAYVNASPNGAKVNAHRLVNRDEVRARINELMGRMADQMTDKIAGTREWVIDRLIENANRAMQAKQATDGAGTPVGDFKWDGNVANRALELLGKEMGMFIDRSENLNTHYGISDQPMTPAEWIAKHATGKPSAPSVPVDKKLN